MLAREGARAVDAQGGASLVPSRAATSLEDDLGWLLGVVLGSTELPLPPRASQFVWSTIASYLDPFIDGEVAAAHYHARSEGLVMARLRREGQPLPYRGGEPGRGLASLHPNPEPKVEEVSRARA